MMMKKKCLLLASILLICAFSQSLWAADVRLTVLQKGSGDAVEEASVLLLQSGESEISDRHGQVLFEDVELPDTLKVLAIGYEAQQQQLRAGEQEKVIYLEPISADGEALMVVEDRVQEKNSKVTLSIDELKRIPGSGGDPIAAINSLPGVVQAGRGPSGGGVYVRGSGNEDNSAWVDRVPIGYLFHMGGLYSTISPDLIQDFNALLGGFQVEYPDRLGGALDIKLRSPKRDRLHQKYSLGTYLSSFTLEGPIGEAGSPHGFFLAARRSYIDLVLSPDDMTSMFSDNEDPEELQNKVVQVPVFYDLQAGWESRLPQGKFSGRFFSAADEVKVLNNRDKLIDPQSAGEIGMKMGFYSANLNWEKQWNERVSHIAPLSFYNSDNRFSIGTDENGDPFFLDIVDNTLLFQPELRILNDDENLLTLGAATGYSETSVEAKIVRRPSEEDIGRVDFSSRDVYGLDDNFRGGQISPYIKYRHDWTSRLTTTTGLRYSYVKATGGMEFKHWQPRINSEYEVLKNTWLLASWGHYVQIPRGSEVAPSAGNPYLAYNEAEHRILGVRFEPDSNWTILLEAFDKPMWNLVTFVDGENPPDNYQNRGRGHARGADILIKRNLSNRRSGWLSYSYVEARRAGADGVMRKFSGDQPHTLTAMWSQGMSGSWKKWDIGFRFQYHSGKPYDPVLGVDNSGTRPVPIYASKKNADRLPDYYQLDLRLDRGFLYNTWKMNFYIDILNVLNIQNVSGYDYGREYEKVDNPDEEVGVPFFPTFGIEAEF
jgi:hypothetical protein